ncbi:siderophore biosynthesis protein [Thioclava dalianensis]|uniref:Siderophore biosynthesis protein n=1 Tax=Thioclava dalianensis TaxID=1185766 RepID=A0A074TH25_9RHOB|nr:GNAT family N-acetyltransferase [Thioclava dalianensis]KEP68313.1 siderophore biosynthesis protein [Thioclava dalianensis]SFN81037.1 Protein N-acetyltransferase, RimJ/RimL family [Thioclava dalianensis]
MAYAVAPAPDFRHGITLPCGTVFAVRDHGDGRIDLHPPEEPISPAELYHTSLQAFELLTAQGPEVALRLTGVGWTEILPRLVTEGIALASSGGPFVLPEAFWQVPGPWLGQAQAPYPLLWQTGPHGRHPRRPPKPEGRLYRRHIPWLGQNFELHALTMDHLPLFHRWQNDPRVAAFFEEAGSLEAHRAYLERLLADPHMMPVIGMMEGVPFAYFELYWCRENRLGAVYEAGPWDRGWHVLVGEAAYRGAAYITAWLPSLMHYMFLAEPRCARIMGEPKASHTQQLRNLGRAGFAHLRDFDFPHKRASLVQLDRQHFFEARLWARPEPAQGAPLAFSSARILDQGDW